MFLLYFFQFAIKPRHMDAGISQGFFCFNLLISLSFLKTQAQIGISRALAEYLIHVYEVIRSSNEFN